MFQNTVVWSKCPHNNVITQTSTMYHMKTGLEMMAGHQTVPGLDARLEISQFKLT